MSADQRAVLGLVGNDRAPELAVSTDIFRFLN